MKSNGNQKKLSISNVKNIDEKKKKQKMIEINFYFQY